MANEIRSRTAFVGGLVEDAPLTISATALTSAGLAGLAVIDTTNHALVILDPDGVGGAPERVYVTAHTASATTATIARGKEGDTARQHLQDVPWIHGSSPKDFDGAGGGSGLIGITSYNPVSVSTISTTSATFADVDATNVFVVFTTPPSGKVLISASARPSTATNTELSWNLREGAADIANTAISIIYQAGVQAVYRQLISGLTPGSAHTYKLGHARTFGSGTAQTLFGGSYGQTLMEVWAVNL